MSFVEINKDKPNRMVLKENNSKGGSYPWV